ncbi:amidase signature domain-containing protein [Neurospora tetraspora]|uniref:Amidase signature domain-containing protein n=1 Tax=Neurospora tetraspora TaxID=94610 RepID=A0AAE0MXJ3_9PEZI|nr:amidase signature domain-containing protein [Neurospora tetraspora]
MRFLQSLCLLPLATAFGSSWYHNAFSWQKPLLGSTVNGVHFPSLLDADLEDLAAGLEKGLFTSVDLVNAYTRRILEVNSTLKAVTQLNPDALTIASELDIARTNGTIRGPLHGIPILLKDNIATADKMDNTAGSYALVGAKVPEDSTVAAKLRKAGAIILGKTNLSEWANFRSKNYTSGWSTTGGQTEGAYYPQQDPSGSSSGSGVASALGLALASLGTETHGSILAPSDANNLVGIKPSVGLTSRYLVVPISEHQDTVGPMARTVKDAAYVLSAIVGSDPNDNYTSAIPFSSDKTPDYVGACDYFALRGARIGVPRNLIEIDGDDDPSTSPYAPLLPAFETALSILRSAGATIIDDLFLPGFDTIKKENFEFTVVDTDFPRNLATYFAQLIVNPHNLTSLKDLERFTHSFPEEDWPEHDTLTWDRSFNVSATTTPAQAWGNYTALQHYAGELGLFGALKNHSLDAMVLPTMFAMGLPAELGSPVISVPMGKYPEDAKKLKNGYGNQWLVAPGVPFGLAFMGERFSEEKLIGLAYAFEQRTKVRGQVRPYLVPRTEVGDVVVGVGMDVGKGDL